MHTAGLGELVAMSLAADVDAHVVYADDSAVVINTKAAESKIGSLAYVKNCFVVLGSVPRRRDLAEAVGTVSGQVPGWRLQRTGKPYRLMFSEDGKLTGVPGNARARLEAAVSRATAGRLQPRGGGDEYWTIGRRDLDEILFCRRLPRPKRPETPKGGLAPDVATLIVNAIGRSRPGDVVLDPFAGSGALIAARIQQPFREAICSDLGFADGSVRLLPQLARRKDVRALSDDARTLTSLPDDTIDVVVTDPPWGEFDQQDSPPSELVAAALGGIRRVLRDNGSLAMLVARRLAGEVAAEWTGSGFAIKKSYDLLINGHPATLFVGAPVPVSADDPTAATPVPGS
ncbi:TRM11 family SAM-dependent methyltransferase [Microlunatus endophyticus]|nr:hypothetical protein [Microlunatus endophyticus]